MMIALPGTVLNIIEPSNITMKLTSSLISPNGNASRNITYPTYVLITPARNEENFIELTIKSVLKQTTKPIKWVIVSDGSTDGTDDIIRKYARICGWVEFVRMPERAERHFAGKANAFHSGYEKVKNLQFDIIGNLDADISFEEDYFSFILAKFAENPDLGVGGTPFREGSSQYDYRFSNIEHVSGACQLFRRKCFDDIGGYPRISGGGIDLVAVTTARMNGWKTRTFVERYCYHHRKIGTGKSSTLKSYFRFGKQDYYLGSHFFWELFRSIYQMKSKPYVLRGLFLITGYLWAVFIRMEKPVSQRFVDFRRKEQMHKLKKFIFG